MPITKKASSNQRRNPSEPALPIPKNNVEELKFLCKYTAKNCSFLFKFIFTTALFLNKNIIKLLDGFYKDEIITFPYKIAMFYFFV